MEPEGFVTTTFLLLHFFIKSISRYLDFAQFCKSATACGRQRVSIILHWIFPDLHLARNKLLLPRGLHTDGRTDSKSHSQPHTRNPLTSLVSGCMMGGVRQTASRTRHSCACEWGNQSSRPPFKSRSSAVDVMCSTYSLTDGSPQWALSGQTRSS